MPRAKRCLSLMREVTDHIGRPILWFTTTIMRCSGVWPSRWKWETSATPDDRGRYPDAGDGMTHSVAYGFAVRHVTAERRAARSIARYRLDSERRQAAEESKEVVTVRLARG